MLNRQGLAPLIYTLIIILLFIVNCRKNLNKKLEPTFQSISKNIFINKCSLYTCHSSAFAEKSGQLDLSDNKAYYQLVNIRSLMYPEIMRIKPGYPDESLLIQRLEGKAVVSVPLERKNITNEDLKILREWIKQGALMN